MTKQKILHRRQKGVLANPFYAIQIDPYFCQEHGTGLTKKQWIAKNMEIVDEIGIEEWLKLLLDSLEGKFIRY